MRAFRPAPSHPPALVRPAPVTWLSPNMCTPSCGRAGAQLTELVVKHRVGQDLPFLRGLLNRPKKKEGADVVSAEAPQPLEAFPWDAAKRLPAAGEEGEEGEEGCAAEA